ncbi:hypothetical protein Acr_21g0006060 [Actinidia rufa]|uniref:Uncharacterized protein n=1 Tax=Actinidia rufa TaxID=165716 RepID=A0A7J0GGR4_9ERIC|nr:hypothetical protein Acr_21g0006060 [Actinidia rufa]
MRTIVGAVFEKRILQRSNCLVARQTAARHVLVHADCLFSKRGAVRRNSDMQVLFCPRHPLGLPPFIVLVQASSAVIVSSFAEQRHLGGNDGLGSDDIYLVMTPPSSDIEGLRACSIDTDDGDLRPSKVDV